MSNPSGRAATKDNTNVAKKSKAPLKPQKPQTASAGLMGWTIFDQPFADTRAVVEEKPSEAPRTADDDTDTDSINVDDSEDNGSDDHQPETCVTPNLLIDHELLKRIGNRHGRPAAKLLDKMLQPCHHINQPMKEIQRCSGNNCGTTFANRNTNRAAKHVRNCISYPAIL